MDKGHRLQRYKETWWTQNAPPFEFAPKYMDFAGDFFFLGTHFLPAGNNFVAASTDLALPGVKWHGYVDGVVGSVDWTLTMALGTDGFTNQFFLTLGKLGFGQFIVQLGALPSPYIWSTDRATFTIVRYVLLNPNFDMYSDQTFSTPNYWQVRHNVWP